MNEQPEAATLAARLKAEHEIAETALPIQRVQIVDVSIPFGSMVALLINVALASIPAMLLVALIGVVFVLFFGGLGMLSTLGR